MWYKKNSWWVMVVPCSIPSPQQPLSGKQAAQGQIKQIPIRLLAEVLFNDHEKHEGVDLPMTANHVLSESLLSAFVRQTLPAVGQ